MLTALVLVFWVLLGSLVFWLCEKDRQAADLQTFKRLVEAGDADGDVAQGQGIHLLAQAGFKTETSD